MSLTEYAARRGVSQSSVSRAIAEGRLSDSVGETPSGRPFINDPELADQEWAENTEQLKSHGGDEFEGSEDLTAAKTRHVSAQADLAELKLARERRELVLAADVEKAIVNAFAAVRSSLLTLPSQMKLDLPHLTQADIDRIDARVRESLEGLAVKAVIATESPPPT